MKFKAPEPDIDPADPYKFDLFERGVLGATLTSMVTQINESFVLSINANWGEGKTTFLKMWEAQLKGKKYQVVYIDAFKIDYQFDPFTNISSQLIDFYATILPDSDSNLIKLKQVVADLSKKGIIAAAKFGSKLLARHHSMSPESAKDFEDMAEVAAETITANSPEIYQDSVEKFRAYLNAICQQVSSESGTKFVIMIDELDRCRPSVALEILEKIKHLFLVNDVVFVLGINKQQLESAVNKVYGDNVNASEYLQKFINYEVDLPKGVIGSGGYRTDRFTNKLIEYYSLNENPQSAEIARAIQKFIRVYSPTKRGIEKIFLNCAVYCWGLENSDVCIEEIAAIFCIYKVLNPENLEIMRIGNAEETRIAFGKELTLWHNAGLREDGIRINNLIMALCNENTDRPLSGLSEFEKGAYQFCRERGIKPNRVLKLHAEKIQSMVSVK
jgi:hypothetical protein